jgi:hypothetical protein
MKKQLNVIIDDRAHGEALMEEYDREQARAFLDGKKKLAELAEKPLRVTTRWFDWR